MPAGQRLVFLRTILKASHYGSVSPKTHIRSIGSLTFPCHTIKMRCSTLPRDQRHEHQWTAFASDTAQGASIMSTSGPDTAKDEHRAHQLSSVSMRRCKGANIMSTSGLVFQGGDVLMDEHEHQRSSLSTGHRLWSSAASMSSRNAQWDKRPWASITNSKRLGKFATTRMKKMHTHNA